MYCISALDPVEATILEINREFFGLILYNYKRNYFNSSKIWAYREPGSDATLYILLLKIIIDIYQLTMTKILRKKCKK